MAQIVRLPFIERARAAGGVATLLQIYRQRARNLFAKFLGRIGAPGAVKDMHIKDTLTGQEVAVHVGALFTRISVNGRDYYFDRITGRFDGTGSAL